MEGQLEGASVGHSEACCALRPEESYRARSERGFEGLRRWRRRTTQEGALCGLFHRRLASFVVIMRLLTLCECACLSCAACSPPLDCANRNAKLRIFGTPPRKFHSPRGEEGPLGHVKGFDTRLRQSRARQASPRPRTPKKRSASMSASTKDWRLKRLGLVTVSLTTAASLRLSLSPSGGTTGVQRGYTRLEDGILVDVETEWVVSPQWR